MKLRTREKTVDLVTRIRRDAGLEVMCHLTVVGQSKHEVRAVLETPKANGIENISLRLRAILPPASPAGRPTLTDFITRRNWSRRP
jgi:methylenetetrahydrofolate reductase (NADPH)